MLVGGFSFNHLGKMSAAMGRIIPLWKVLTTSKNMKVSWDSYSQIFPIYWEKKHIPNHQPVIYKCWIYGAFLSHGATPSHHIIHFRLGFPYHPSHHIPNHQPANQESQLVPLLYSFLRMPRFSCRMLRML